MPVSRFFSRSSIYQSLATFGFVLLFPGFVLYHDLVARAMIPSVFGGFFSWVGLLLFVLLFVPSVLRITTGAWRGDKYALLITILFIYLGGVVGWHCVLMSSNSEVAAVNQAAQTLILWLSLLFVGVWLSINWPSFRSINWLAFFAALFLLLFYVFTTGSIMYYASSFSDADGVASYQGYARSALVLLLLLVAIAQSNKQTIALFLGGAFILFVLGARSELFAFLAVVPIYLTLAAFRSPRLMVLLIVMFLMLSAVVVFAFEFLTQSRQLQVLNLGEASSWIARQQLMQESWQTILANPLMGKFGGHVHPDGSEGSYAHNILSAWASYGLVGFILILLASIWATISSAFLVIRQSNQNSGVSFAFLLNAAVLLLLLVSKSIFWVLPGLAFGVYLAQRKNIRKTSAKQQTPYQMRYTT